MRSGGGREPSPCQQPARCSGATLATAGLGAGRDAFGATCHARGGRRGTGPCLLAGASADGVAPQPRLAVWEYVLLFRLREGREPEQAVAALEAVWGLQYLLPGCVCASGGPVMQDPACLHGSGATHALHVRFSGRQQADSFRSHPVAQAAFRSEITPVAADIVELLFEAEVERDIFSMFRKGPEWDTGAEHLLLLQGPGLPVGSSGSGSVGDFVQRLARLALESRSEALQVCAGPVLTASGGGTEGATWALMVRFPTAQQLRWFVESPPHRALLAADERLPLRAALSATWELLPAEGQQERPAPRQVTDA